MPSPSSSSLSSRHAVILIILCFLILFIQATLGEVDATAETSTMTTTTSSSSSFLSSSASTQSSSSTSVKNDREMTASSVTYLAAASADEVLSLPGAESLTFNFRQFSGYLDIPGTSSSGNLTKHIHYWFVESMNNPVTDPIAFWTNGGPGCSGLIAFFTEQGPFRPNSDGTLSLNPFAWNRIANMVFVEIPCGVGFSYSSGPTDSSTKQPDYTASDNSTAYDNYATIQAFFAKFPAYRSNRMYITSESYGGHYLPTLAKVIVNENKKPTENKPILNFQGFAVGNPYTTPYSGEGAMLDTFWGHQLLPKPLYDLYQKICGAQPSSNYCHDLVGQLFSAVGGLNPYALDYPVCLSPSSSSRRKEGFSDSSNDLRHRHGRSLAAGTADMNVETGLDRAHGNFRMMAGSSAQQLWMLNYMFSRRSPELRKAMVSLASVDEYEPCEDDYTTSYLNNNVVKAAIHVKEDVSWAECSNHINYHYTDEDISMVPIYKYLIDGGYKLDILVYSGDNDAVCSTLGTQMWIWDMGYKAAGQKWTVYEYEGQTAGYLTRFHGAKLAFLTVHGAGHEVPTYRPDVAFDMWSLYLGGKLTN